MIILKTTDTPQSIHLIRRVLSGTILSLRDDQTNITNYIDFSGNVTESSNYSEINMVWNLTEGHSYDLTLYNTEVIGDVLSAPISFRGLIYCTDQDTTLNTPLSYSEGKVTEHNTDNKYTIYE